MTVKVKTELDSQVAKFLYESGLGFEINRNVLHPLGLAFSIKFDCRDQAIGLAIMETDDPTGIEYTEEQLEVGSQKYYKYLKEQNGESRMAQRLNELGYIIQDAPLVETAMALTFSKLQEEQAKWELHNFGPQPAHHSFLGMVEELGELAHAILKGEQSIRGTPEEHEAAAKDAIGDMTVFAASLCNKRGWDYQKVMEDTWADVKVRDWKKFPMNGLSK
jgi:NTP pyrophosphatase (non-canonical NTP hydrolase)